MTGRHLEHSHRASLHASGLTDETIDAAGIYTETDHQRMAEALNVAELFTRDLVPALAIPYPGTDFVTYRPDNPRTKGERKKPNAPRLYVVRAPDGRDLRCDGMFPGGSLKLPAANDDAIKYESPRGRKPPLYIPAGNRPGGKLYIHEGAKKALAGHQEGQRAVGLGGVSMWRDGLEESISAGESLGQDVRPDLLAECRAAGNQCVLVFDSPDMVRNKNVLREAVLLAKALMASNVDVEIAWVPMIKGAVKTGFDDWVAHMRTTNGAEVKDPTRYLTRYPADPMQALADVKRERQRDDSIPFSATKARQLASFALAWVNYDKKLFRAWRKEFSSISRIGTQEVDEFVASLQKPFKTPLLAYLVPGEGYAFRTDEKKAFTIKLINKSAALIHLQSCGLRSDEAKTIIDKNAMPVAYGFECRHDMPATYEHDGELRINTYQPPKLVPHQPADSTGFPRIRKILETLTGNDPAALDWFMHWLAAKVQNPSMRPNVAIIMQGAPGTGKDTLAAILREVFGEGNFATIGQEDLESAFNSHFAGRPFIFGNEVSTRKNLNENTGPLKAYIGSPVISVNTKNQPQTMMKNASAWLLASNKTEPVRLEKDDRRFTVFRNYAVPPREYAQMVRGCWDVSGQKFTDDFVAEINAFAWHLMWMNVDRDLILRPLENEARRDLLEVGKTSVQVFAEQIREIGVDTVLSRYGFNGGLVRMRSANVDTSELYYAYKQFCEQWGIFVVQHNIFGIELRREFPDVIRKQVRVGNDRPYVYIGLPASAATQGGAATNEPTGADEKKGSASAAN